MTPTEWAERILSEVHVREDNACDGVAALVAAAVAEEREACAKIVEEGYVGNRVETDFGDIVRAKAAALRART